LTSPTISRRGNLCADLAICTNPTRTSHEASPSPPTASTTSPTSNLHFGLDLERITGNLWVFPDHARPIRRCESAETHLKVPDLDPGRLAVGAPTLPRQPCPLPVLYVRRRGGRLTSRPDLGQTWPVSPSPCPTALVPLPTPAGHRRGLPDAPYDLDLALGTRPDTSCWFAAAGDPTARGRPPTAAARSPSRLAPLVIPAPNEPADWVFIDPSTLRTTKNGLEYNHDRGAGDRRYKRAGRPSGTPSTSQFLTRLTRPAAVLIRCRAQPDGCQRKFRSHRRACSSHDQRGVNCRPFRPPLMGTKGTSPLHLRRHLNPPPPPLTMRLTRSTELGLVVRPTIHQFQQQYHCALPSCSM